jgi:hypothetical protein
MTDGCTSNSSTSLSFAGVSVDNIRLFWPRKECPNRLKTDAFYFLKAECYLFDNMILGPPPAGSMWGGFQVERNWGINMLVVKVNGTRRSAEQVALPDLLAIPGMCSQRLKQPPCIVYHFPFTLIGTPVADMTDSILDGVQFVRTKMDGTVLAGASAQGANFTEAEMRNVQAPNADLSGAR